LKVKKLIGELEKLIEEHGENIDVQTFSGELGIYKKWEEIKRICVEE
jgi:hypothetical protein